MTIGERVTQAREAAGLTIAELARRVGISRSAIGQIEAGTTKSPTAGNLQKIADKTGVRFKWLLDGKGSMKESPKVDAAVNQVETTAAIQSPSVTVRDGVMTEEEAKLLDVYNRLSAAARGRLMNKAKALAFDEMEAAKQNPTEKRA